MVEIISKVIDFIKHIITIVVLILSFISSLFMQPKDNVKTRETLIEKTRIEYINEVGPEIIRCLNEKDKKGLNDLFCEKVRNTEYLKKQINFLFNYIEKNGEIKIDDGKWIDNGGHGSQNYGRKVVDCNGWKYEKEILIGSQYYKLYCSAYITLLGHREYEGIYEISFIEQVNDSIKTSQSDDDVIYDGGKQKRYLGVEILVFNDIIVKRENIVAEKVPLEKEYMFTFDELEKGRSEW